MNPPWLSARHGPQIVRHGMAFSRAFLVALALIAATSVQGQLTITEVMSSAATTRDGVTVAPGPDFWELTNYGTEAVDLTGYRFNDNTGKLAGADAQPFADRVVQPGASVVFVQREDRPGLPAVTAESFRTLWGLAPSVAVVLYNGNGFGAAGDEVLLWDSTATTSDDVVDRVQFGEAFAGRSFTYNPAAGLFGGLSTVGVDGAFRAALSDDVGSPGIGPAPLPLAITQQPRNVVANPGDTVSFSVTFRGLPKPSYTWYFNDNPFPIAHGQVLTLTSVQLKNEGRYHVVLDNGRSLVISEIATLSIRRQLSAPIILQPLEDHEVYVGQNATFQIVASGLPQPTLQWWFNQTPIDDVLESELALVNIQLGEAGLYSVVATNPLGSVTNSGRLKVIARPRLQITEVMSSPSTNLVQAPHDDWWELTNFDDHPVDLFGYHFDDEGETMSPSLASAWTNPEHRIINPGESVILVENLSAEDFRQWWGPVNLPPGLQIITYRGAALSLSATRGDVIWLWNSGATDDKDYLEAVDFVGSPFGRTFTYNPVLAGFVGTSEGLSVDGVNGAFTAVEGGDVGSPGFVTAPPPKFVEWISEPGGIRLKWRAITGRKYTLLSTATVEVPNWRILVDSLVAGSGLLSYFDAAAASDASRYYRVVLEGEVP